MPVDADEIFSESTPLAPSVFFSLPSNSIADSFIYWGPCGSRNSFAGGFFCNTGDAGQGLGTAPG